MTDPIEPSKWERFSAFVAKAWAVRKVKVAVATVVAALALRVAGVEVDVAGIVEFFESAE